jgi:O-antigen biosynthesis protein
MEGQPESVSRYATSEPTGARRELLERVTSRATVLDIGCWSGSMGAFLIRHRNAQVDGVEPDQLMAAEAHRHYRHVWVSQIETILEHLVSEQEGSYDCLLFLDVLEHLANPEEVLRRSRRLLRPGGMALVSIPNVAHWSLRVDLARGRWTYRENGLLDRTHLQFFTQLTAAELMVAAGWTILWRGCDVDGRPLLPQTIRAQRLMRRWPRLFGVQFLFELSEDAG